VFASGGRFTGWRWRRDARWLCARDGTHSTYRSKPLGITQSLHVHSDNCRFSLRVLSDILDGHFEKRRSTKMKFVLGIVIVTVASGGEVWRIPSQTPAPAAGLEA
jgi:hypothetical protein